MYRRYRVNYYFFEGKSLKFKIYYSTLLDSKFSEFDSNSNRVRTSLHARKISFPPLASSHATHARPSRRARVLAMDSCISIRLLRSANTATYTYMYDRANFDWFGIGFGLARGHTSRAVCERAARRGARRTHVRRNEY